MNLTSLQARTSISTAVLLLGDDLDAWLFVLSGDVFSFGLVASFSDKDSVETRKAVLDAVLASRKVSFGLAELPGYYDVSLSGFQSRFDEVVDSDAACFKVSFPDGGSVEVCSVGDVLVNVLSCSMLHERLAALIDNEVEIQPIVE